MESSVSILELQLVVGCNSYYRRYFFVWFLVEIRVPILELHKLVGNVQESWTITLKLYEWIDLDIPSWCLDVPSWWILVVESRETMLELHWCWLGLCTFPIDEGSELLPHVVEMIVVPLARNIMDNIVLRGVIKGPSV